MLFIFTRCLKSGPINQMYNLIKNLDRNLFDPVLLTLYNENEKQSLYDEYKKIIECYCIKTSKFEMLFGRLKNIRLFIKNINPKIIHTLGVFPDFMIYKIGFNNHVLTSRNFVFDDYPNAYGFLIGNLLALFHLRIIKRTKFSLCCSKSLHQIYLDNLKIDLPYIRNGVDNQKFSSCNISEKQELRYKLNLPLDKKIFIYSALFNNRKNQEFILRIINNNQLFDNYYFVFLGDGPRRKDLMNLYKRDNVFMPGNVDNVIDYLRSSDYYISSSLSEGMPNGVLEGMSIGLPILLSNIPQHKEILELNQNSGLSYIYNDEKDFIKKFDKLVHMDYDYMSRQAFLNIKNNFASNIMSKNYQDYYQSILNEGDENIE